MTRWATTRATDPRRAQASRRRLPLAAAAAAVGMTALLICTSAQLGEDAPSVRSLMSQASRAREEGRVHDAVQLYEQVVERAPTSERRRPEALYWAGLLRLSPDPQLRDADRSKEHLTALKTDHPLSGRAQEASIALALAEDINGCEERVQASLAEAAELTNACEHERSLQAEQVVKSQVAAKEFEADLKTAHEEIEMLKEENHKLTAQVREKEEALQKVKEVLSQWKPKR